MSSEDSQNWVMSGHDIIFEKIMMMVGLHSLESLHMCRQVCRTWNDMIMRIIWESPRKRNIFKIRIERIKMRIEKNWGLGRIFPSDEEISYVKWLGKNKKSFWFFSCERSSSLCSVACVYLFPPKLKFTLFNLLNKRAGVSERGLSVTGYFVYNQVWIAETGRNFSLKRESPVSCESNCGIKDIVSDTGSFSCFWPAFKPAHPDVT